MHYICYTSFMNYTEQLQEKRYATINYPNELKQTMGKAAQAWKDFCAIPNNLKEQLEFSNYGGYELKQDPRKADLKENMHYGLNARGKFEAYAHSLDSDEDRATVLGLIDHTDQVIEMVKPLIKDFICEVEEKIGIKDMAKSILESREHWLVRYLHYFPTDDLNRHAAAPHCDIGGFTLHLFQDHHGLEYLDSNRDWRDLPLEEGFTSILPGIQMQHVSNNQITSTCHRVVPTEESAKTGRYSAVLFIDWPGRANWNKQEHGRLQNREPGFNYDMSFEELDSLFHDQDLEEI